MKALRKLWAKYRTIIDWLKANAAYITIIPNILFSRPVLNIILAAMVAFGLFGPETANSVKDAVLGSDLADTIEVIDHAK
jgi:hypothetical protein|tara:strand:+ start:34724 stop:34963 length:240 start_codon:yes stop_codon:yes gene_type:complete